MAMAMASANACACAKQQVLALDSASGRVRSQWTVAPSLVEPISPGNSLSQHQLSGHIPAREAALGA